jgi:hypothetical protein
MAIDRLRRQPALTAETLVFFASKVGFAGPVYRRTPHNWLLKSTEVAGYSNCA